MTKERMIEIFEDDEMHNWKGDNAYKGLSIIAKYTEDIIGGADHYTIYSEYIDKLIEAGITEEDCIELRRLNWMIKDEDYLACFV